MARQREYEPFADQTPQDREVRVEDLSGGLNDSQNEALLGTDETPDCLNVDFDRGSVAVSGGAIKFNNQSAPGAAVLAGPDPALSPLYVMRPRSNATGVHNLIEVPNGGACFFPYREHLDIGGRFTSEGDFRAGSESFHIRRGRSFEINVSFRIPPEEKLYEWPSNGIRTSAGSTINPPHGYDQALDECFCIVQKGGDRTTPMSWALAVVNTGTGINIDSSGAAGAYPSPRKASAYALAFIWYDAPQWGEAGINVMKYNLTSGQHPTSGGASQFCTQAYRAVIIHEYVEPGRDYSVAIQLKMDSGSCGTTDGGGTNTAWQHDGYFAAHVYTDRTDYWFAKGANTALGTITQTSTDGVARLNVLRGPSDSLEYLCKYGIRYAGRDAMHTHKGNRFTPWNPNGFIPFGSDLTPLRRGGFCMLDRHTVQCDDLYGAVTPYTLTTSHTSGNAYVTVNHLGLATGNTNGGDDPKRPGFLWDGFASSTAAGFNSGALNGYKFVIPAELADGGCVIQIIGYAEVGGVGRVTIYDGANAARFGDWATEKTLIQCFRWHQRRLVIGQLKIRREPVDYLDAEDAALASRRKISLRMSSNLADKTDDTLDGLQACWPMDDAGGTTLREIVGGSVNDGYMTPFGLGVSQSGTRGKNRVFLSGEGEAICRDLTDDAIFQREIQRMLRGQSQGFGVEVTCEFPEAYYALALSEELPQTFGSGAGPGNRPTGVPPILTWDIKEKENGTRCEPRSLLSFGFQTLLRYSDTRPFTRPAGFGLEINNFTDSEDTQPIVPSALLPWYVDGGVSTRNRWDETAPWVGKTVTIQVGIERTAVAGTYNVWIAVTPKSSFLPENGDPSGVEMQYWTDAAANTASGGSYSAPAYFESATLVIAPKDLARSVLVIGGSWNCRRRIFGAAEAYEDDNFALGAHEVSARMIVDEVRWFGASPSGNLADYLDLRALAYKRDGKLVGSLALPAGRLTQSDIVKPLGRTLETVSVIDGSRIVTPAGIGTFNEDAARESPDAITGGFLVVDGDVNEVGLDEQLRELRQDFYYIESVAAGGASLTLANAYSGPTRVGARAGVFRLIGYTAFEDDIRDVRLMLGRGRGYNGETASVADALLTDELWADETPVGGGWKLRIYSALGGLGSDALLPQWTRGLVYERRIADDGILGLYGFSGQVYAGTRGNLFIADDRWRVDGPTDELERSLDFLARIAPGNVAFPRHCDYALQRAATRARMENWGDRDFVFVWDCWVKLSGVNEYQTVLWIGNPATDPSQNASSTGHVLNTIMRFERGYPQLVFGSTETFDGLLVPDKGQYVATAAQAITPDVWTHVRWTVGLSEDLLKFELPICQIMGKRVGSSVNATGDLLTGDNWLTAANVVTVGQTGRIVIGAARDSYRSLEASGEFPLLTGELPPGSGTLLPPQRLQGFVHSLNGRAASIVLAKLRRWEGDGPDDFNPYEIDYEQIGAALRYCADFQQFGVGHKLRDLSGVNDTPAVIHSHPFISVFHEMGLTSEPYSFAEWGQQLYVTNGGRPVVVTGESAVFAGVPAPVAQPTFRTERFPLMVVNHKNANDDGNDPVMPGVDTENDPLQHFSTNGNAYLRLPINSKDAGKLLWTDEQYFGFKCFLKPNRVDGRIQVMRCGEAGVSGPFLDIVDGKVRFGWYDTDQKRDVYVETSGPVFWPGYWHYVYLRKRKALGSQSTDGNWENSWWSNVSATLGIRRFTLAVGAYNPAVGTSPVVGVSTNFCTILRVIRPGTASVGAIIDVFTTGNSAGAPIAWAPGDTIDTIAIVTATVPSSDMLVVKRFRKSTDTTLESQTSHDAYCQDVEAADTRNCVSLTTDSVTAPDFTAPIGIVSPQNITFTVTGTASIIQIDAAATTRNSGWLFRKEMVGMYMSFDAVATEAWYRRVYRISALNGALTQATLVDPATGAAADLTGLGTNNKGVVFHGIALVKSPGFDESVAATYSMDSVYLMGGPQQESQLAGYTPFSGEMACPMLMSDAPASDGVDARVFENASAVTSDPTLIGTDGFEDQVYEANATRTHQLQGETTGPYVLFGWDFRDYGAVADVAATSKNAESSVSETQIGPQVVRGTGSSAVIGTAQLQWHYTQRRDLWTGERYIALGFFDPAQNLYGAPGAPLLIQPSEDDEANPSGLVRLVLTDLPVGRPGHEVVVYESLAGGNAATLFQVARVGGGTAEVGVEFTEERIGLGLAAEFANGEPPRCSLVASSAARIVYGALESQPDAIVPSRPGQAGAADFQNLFRIAGGAGSAITAMGDLDGLLVVFKRRAMASVTFNAANFALPEIVSTGVGCIARQSLQAKDGVLWFLSDRGVQVVTRTGVTNLAYPLYVGENVEHLFTLEADLRRLSRASACMSRRRDQYVVSLRLAGEKRAYARLSAESRRPDVTIQRVQTSFSRYAWPAVSALAAVQSKDEGYERVIAGTEDGFVVWMDRDDTGLVMMGPSQQHWGFTNFPVYVESSLASVATSGREDSALEGPAGAVVTYYDAAGELRHGHVLCADGSYMHFSDLLPAPIPADASVLVGVKRFLWESAWLDMGNPERRKTVLYLELVLETDPPVGLPDSKFQVQIFADSDRTPKHTQEIDLAQPPPYEINGIRALAGQRFKLSISPARLAEDVHFDLAAVVWRLRDQGQK